MLKKRLLEIDGLPAVSWYNAQYDPEQDEAVYHIPHVYIEFTPLAPRALGERVQGADMTFRVRLMTEHYDDDSRIAEHFEIVREIFQALHGWQARLSFLPEYAALEGEDEDLMVLNKITRTGIEPDHAQTNCIITVQDFSCAVIDADAARTYIQVPAEVEVIRP